MLDLMWLSRNGSTALLDASQRTVSESRERREPPPKSDSLLESPEILRQ